MPISGPNPALRISSRRMRAKSQRAHGTSSRAALRAISCPRARAPEARCLTRPSLMSSDNPVPRGGFAPPRWNQGSPGDASGDRERPHHARRPVAVDRAVERVLAALELDAERVGAAGDDLALRVDAVALDRDRVGDGGLVRE